MNTDERYVRFQLWCVDHDGNRILYNEWSDGELSPADVLRSELLVDLQHWDAPSGVIFNHLVDAGWQVGTVPYGIDPDAPIPEILPDNETLREPAPALKPDAVKAAPVPDQGKASAEASTALPGVPGAFGGHPEDPLRPPQTSKVGPAPAPAICIFPAGTRAPIRSERRSRGWGSILCGWICVLVLISAISKCSTHATTMTPRQEQHSAALAVPRNNVPGATPPSSSASSSVASPPMVRRALPVDRKVVVCRALPVVRRATLVGRFQ